MTLSQLKNELRLIESRIAASNILFEKIEDPEYQRLAKTAKNALTYKAKNTAHQQAGQRAAELGDTRRSELHMKAAGAASAVVAKKKGASQPRSIQRRVAKAFMPVTKAHLGVD
jgi:hypothetical protein